MLEGTCITVHRAQPHEELETIQCKQASNEASNPGLHRQAPVTV